MKNKNEATVGIKNLFKCTWLYGYKKMQWKKKLKNSLKEQF